MTPPVVRLAVDGLRAARQYDDRTLADMAARHAVTDWLRRDGHRLPDCSVDIRHSAGAAPRAIIPALVEVPGPLVLSVSHIPGRAAAAAGRVGALGVDLVETNRFTRFLGQPEHTILQRRLTGTNSPTRSIDELRCTAAVKEAVGKAVNARANGLSWPDVSLRPDESLSRRLLAGVTVEDRTPGRSGRFDVEGLTGAWGWWLLSDGAGVAVAVR